MCTYSIHHCSTYCYSSIQLETICYHLALELNTQSDVQTIKNWNEISIRSRLHFKCDGTCTETRFRLSANQQGHQFSRLLAAEVCALTVVMLDTPCSEVVWRVLTTHSIRQFPLHFPSCALPCAITFQLESRFGVLSIIKLYDGYTRC